MKPINFIIILFCFIQVGVSQESYTEQDKKFPPKFSVFRSFENYEYLKHKQENIYKKDFFDPIKFIPLNKKKNVYLSLGGQFRPRFEHYSNRFWTQEENNYYSQRIAFHTDLVFGTYFRVFSELYHGLNSDQKRFTDSDDLDFFQLFTQFTFPLKNNSTLSFVLGRQEVSYGKARLIGIREGPNIRRSFDMMRSIIAFNKTNIQVFFGKEVRANFSSFDNKFTLFNSNATTPKIWGIYNKFTLKAIPSNNDFYYIGYHKEKITFNDITGEETRHSLGLRRYGRIGKNWQYNTEFIYQFGKLDDTKISAFNFETDWHYLLYKGSWKPNAGLKLIYASGDKEQQDDKMGTFNPLFVNPSVYSLASTVTPINMISVHPSFTITPIKNLKILTEYAFFWRASKNDGLYRPPNIPIRLENSVSTKDLGSQIGLQVDYIFNRHLSFNLNTSYYIVGKFQKATGDAEHIFHIAPTFSYRF